MRRFLKSLFGADVSARHTVRRAIPRTRLGLTNLEERLTPVAPTDLVLSQVTSLQAIVAPGETIQAQFIVGNEGFTALGQWSDQVSFNGSVIATVPHTGPLGLGANYTVTTPGVVPADTPTGFRTLRAVTDSANQISESSETNNARTKQVLVLPSALAGSVRTTLGQLEARFGGSLVPTAVATNAAGATSITFNIVGGTYRIGGYTVTELQATVTVTSAGVVSAINGSANLRVPMNGSSTIVVPITFSGNSTSLTVSGATNVASFQYGSNPRVVATNATVQVNLTVQLASSSVTGTATVTAANVTLQSSGTTVLSATNFQGQISSAGSLTASAATISVLSGRANAAAVSFSYALNSGRITGTVASVTGAIGPVQMSATNAALVIDPASSDPMLSVASAQMTFPRNGSSVTVNVTGFRLTQTGRFQFDAAALNLPGQTNGGAEITGSFSGDVRLSGTTVYVTLNGAAQGFDTNAQIQGELTASSTGMFGFLTLRTNGASDTAVLGQNLGFTYTGTARLMVNTTNVTRTITTGGQSRSLAANTGRLVADGSLTVQGFTLIGVLDIVPGANNSAQITLSADLNLGQFGLLSTNGTGSFRIANGGLVGAIGTNRVSFPSGGFALNGTLTLKVNTTAGTLDNIAPGVEVRAASGITASGYTINGAVSVGFRNNTGTTNDYYFANISGSTSLLNGLFTSTLTGEVRSNGYVSLAGSTTITISESMTAGTGISMVGTLAVNLTRTSGTGTISFGASFDGTIRWLGIELLGASASFTSAGHVHVVGEVFGVGILSWDFDL